MALRRGGDTAPYQGGWERIDFKWDGKFPKKRNWVLRNYKFKTPWVLFLDADERSFESHVAKHREYANWETNRYRQLMAHPERWEALSPRQKMKYRNLTKWWLAPAYFAVCYFRKLGFLDGYAGLRFALFKAWYFALIRKQLRMG